MKRIYIPANLDIDEILKRIIPKIKYFHKDKLMYILGLISSLLIKMHDNVRANKYAVPIYSGILKKIIPYYKAYLDYLIENKIIEKSGNYNIDAGISNSYQFTTRYLFVELIEYRITYKPLLKNLSRRYKKERVVGSEVLLESKNAISFLAQKNVNKINNFNKINNLNNKIGAEINSIISSNTPLLLYVETISEIGNSVKNDGNIKSSKENQISKSIPISNLYPLLIYVIHCRNNNSEIEKYSKNEIPELEKENTITINHLFLIYVVNCTEVENNVKNDGNINYSKENKISKSIPIPNNYLFLLYVIHCSGIENNVKINSNKEIQSGKNHSETVDNQESENDLIKSAPELEKEKSIINTHSLPLYVETSQSEETEELHPIFRQEELLKNLEFTKGIYSKVDSLCEDEHRKSIHMARVDKIVNKDIETSVDLTGYRFHSNLTTLKRDLRNYLRYIDETHKDSTFVNIDIKNSQPFFSLLLLNEEFWTEENNLFLNRNPYRKKSSDPEITSMFNMNKGISGRKLTEIDRIRQYVNKIPKEAIDYYKEIVISGDLYETMQESIKFITDEDKLRPREDVKKALFEVIFSGNRYQSRNKKIFAHLFPEVDQLFRMIKKKRKERLAILLQRIESNIVVNNIYCDIYDYNKDIPVFTIHDSIVTIKEYEQEVLKIVRDCFDKYIGFQPTLKVEHWIE